MNLCWVGYLSLAGDWDQTGLAGERSHGRLAGQGERSQEVPIGAIRAGQLEGGATGSRLAVGGWLW